MKLLQLTSENPKFRAINFESGLNIVVGSQLTAEQKKSINGIGKSMSLSLIHYMFGSTFKTKSEKKLEEYLAKYGAFELTFSHKKKEYRIKKDFSQSEFYINEEKITKARTMLFNAAVGILLVFGAYIATDFITSVVIGAIE